LVLLLESLTRTARPLYLTINARPNSTLSSADQEFIRFVFSRQGQEIVAEAGFFPLTASLAEAQLRRVGLSPARQGPPR
jgi:phosphate transport system substrate-binding protein